MDYYLGSNGKSPRYFIYDDVNGMFCCRRHIYKIIINSRLPATQILFSIGFGGALITLVLAIFLNVNLADKILINKHVISRTIADLFGALSLLLPWF